MGLLAEVARADGTVAIFVRGLVKIAMERARAGFAYVHQAHE